MNEPVIMNPSNWADALSAIGSALLYLDSIVLFDVPNVHLTVLGFDIAVFVFGIVWNTVGLWHYDFDSALSDSPDNSVDLEVSDEEFFAQFTSSWEKDPEPPDSEIDISAEDDDDYN